ncbi:MAG: MoaD/ThiS family protein [Silicimonas sp.]|jgi:molybdopterin converting factor small subunit|nr:MoaD/ThiS family protein [Silicimonas sp.]
MVEVTLWSGLVPLADNQRKLEIEAGTIRELLGKLQDRYPGLKEPIRSEVAVVVDGTVYRNDWSQELAPDADVFLMRRLTGG